jgi:hypothetical protein
MIALDRLMIGGMLLAAVLIAGALQIKHYGAERYSAGQAAAVAAGAKLRQVEADRNRKTETDLRAQLDVADKQAHETEKTYEISLEAAQRRVRTGVDSLRCPASAVPASAAAGDRRAAGGPATDVPGQELVPEAASDLLGDGAAIAGLVRRYERVVERFEACRAVNEK